MKRYGSFYGTEINTIANWMKESLVYDLEEPFRWLIDLTVMQAFEYGKLDLHDSYFTGDDYQYKFDAEAKSRFLDYLRARFNSGVRCNGRVLRWDTVIQDKTNELARYLSAQSRMIDFSEPGPVLTRTDDLAVREVIQSLSQSEARKRCISKSTLHYLREKTRSRSSFRVYSKTISRLRRPDLSITLSSDS